MPASSVPPHADRGYTPHLTCAEVLEKLCEGGRLKAMAAAQTPAGRRKHFHTEAAHAGFKTCGAAKDYATSVAFAQRLPKNMQPEGATHPAQVLRQHDSAAGERVT